MHKAIKTHEQARFKSRMFSHQAMKNCLSKNGTKNLTDHSCSLFPVNYC